MKAIIIRGFEKYAVYGQEIESEDLTPSGEIKSRVKSKFRPRLQR